MHNQTFDDFHQGWLGCTLTNIDRILTTLDGASAVSDMRNARLSVSDTDRCRALLAELQQCLQRMSQDTKRPSINSDEWTSSRSTASGCVPQRQKSGPTPHSMVTSLSTPNSRRPSVQSSQTFTSAQTQRRPSLQSSQTFTSAQTQLWSQASPGHSRRPSLQVQLRAAQRVDKHIRKEHQRLSQAPPESSGIAAVQENRTSFAQRSVRKLLRSFSSEPAATPSRADHAVHREQTVIHEHEEENQDVGAMSPMGTDPAMSPMGTDPPALLGLEDDASINADLWTRSSRALPPQDLDALDSAPLSVDLCQEMPQRQQSNSDHQGDLLDAATTLLMGPSSTNLEQPTSLSSVVDPPGSAFSWQSAPQAPAYQEVMPPEPISDPGSMSPVPGDLDCLPGTVGRSPSWDDLPPEVHSGGGRDGSFCSSGRTSVSALGSRSSTHSSKRQSGYGSSGGIRPSTASGLSQSMVDEASLDDSWDGDHSDTKGKKMIVRTHTKTLDKVASNLILTSQGSRASLYGSLKECSCATVLRSSALYAEKFLQLLVLGAALYSLVMTPIMVCFTDTPSIALSSVEVLCEWSLLMGVVLPFLLGIEDPEKLHFRIRARSDIVEIYGKYYLIADMVSSLPWHLVWLLTGKSSSMNFLRSFSICRLLRLPGLMGGTVQTQYLQFAHSTLHPNLVRALRLIILFFYVVHLVACGYYAVGSSNPSEWAFYAKDDNHSTLSEWVNSFYWALCAIMGENMGPAADFEVFYNSLVLAGGVLLNSCIVGSMASMLGTLDERAAKQKSKLDTIDTFMQRNNVERDIFDQVQQYYKYLYSSVSRDAGMLADLSPALRLKIDLCIHQRFISNCHMFSSCSVECVATLVTIISRNWAIHTPSDVVFSKGEVGDAMYFVLKGEIMLYNPPTCRFPTANYEEYEDLDQQELQTLRRGGMIPGAKLFAICTPGGFFGELALVIEGSMRAASAASYSFAELLNLPRGDFEYVLELYPDFHQKMKEMVAERVEQNRQSLLHEAEDAEDRMRNTLGGGLLPGSLGGGLSPEPE